MNSLKNVNKKYHDLAKDVLQKELQGKNPSKAQIEKRAKMLIKERIDFITPKIPALRAEAKELNEENMGLLAAYMLKR